MSEGAARATESALGGTVAGGSRPQVLPGLFPPRPGTLEGSLRRMLLVLNVLLVAGGAAAYLALSRDPALALPLALAAIGVLAASVVPWHRLDRDAFAFFGVAAGLWMAWFIALTGGAGSPHQTLYFVAVGLCAIPLSRVLGTAVASGVAALSLLPALYQPLSVAQTEALVSHAAVLVAAALCTPWLMHELRGAITRVATTSEQLGREQEVTAELRRAQVARQEYMSVLAHELRNPLVGIGLAARVIAKETPGTPSEPHAQGIVTEIRHALELLDGLTDASSLEAGRLRSALRPIDLVAIVREAVGALHATDHTIELRGVDRPMIVLGDGRRLGQVIRNLVGNAMKYSPARTTIEVSVGVSADRNQAIVEVRDEGPGIPPLERPRLFQKFARLSTAGSIRGSGLGLYVSRGIVKDHSGELWVDWPAGGGTVFSFSVPLADARIA
ncbi:MAG TPA: HAMP domain-containing sensor histidine kinase [Candidatus Limnocylindrales bacterium]|nr:HAMP domain-containing sensor histidine kinase [Candidatus Limnocylindrales bacterium]